jgi:CheY-like chemotaxis protein
MTKILLVEDELFVRELYERVLTQSGFEILSAIDGEEGVQKALLHPDLILLDIMKPKLNGIEALKQIKANSDTKKIPVILLTNLGQEDIIKEAIKIGAQGYIMKMRVTPYEIVEHVRDFLQNPTQQMNASDLDLE